jgi:hypothetical protein
MGRPVLAGRFVVMFRGQFPYCLRALPMSANVSSSWQYGPEWGGASC